MTSLDLITVRLLVAIDELGSINAAARSLGITQPAASARLREFEARWRVPFAVRTARGTSLTDDGAAVAVWARKILREAAAMEAGLQALAGARAGDLDVAASLTIAEFLMPRWMSRLHAERPDVRPHLQMVNSETVLDSVRRGQSSIGFIENAVEPLGFEHRVVGYDTVLIAVRPDHPWARRRYPIPAAQLRDASYVLREPGSGTRSTFERALRMTPDVAFEASSTQALISAAIANVGPVILSALAIHDELDRGRLVAVESELNLRRPLAAIWTRGQRLSTSARDLLDIAISMSATDSAPPVTQIRPPES